MSKGEVAGTSARFRRLADLEAGDLAGRIVCLRMEDISLDAAPELADFKLHSVLSSLETLVSAHARSVILSRLDDPKYLSNRLDAQRVVCSQLALLSGRPVRLAEEESEVGVRRAVAGLAEGESLMLSHLGSEPADKENRPEFARFLAGLCDIYCMEAFSLAHEVSVSTVGAPAIAPLAIAGAEFQRAFETLSDILDHPERPVLAIFGGSLSLGKMMLLERIAPLADVVLIGGELALAFHKAEGMPVGTASVPEVAAQAAGRILSLVRSVNTRLLTPQDHITVNARSVGRHVSEVLFSENADSLDPEHLVVDIGSRTRHSWSEQLPPSRTILWHAPMGICEFPPYSEGTLFFAEEIVRRTSPTLHKVIICGESLTGFLLSRGFPPERVDCFSPAGSTILHYAARYPLPVIEALNRSASKTKLRPAVLLALTGCEEDARLASFAGGWFPDTCSVHCLYVRSGPDQNRNPDLYAAMTESERLAETWQIQGIFGRAEAALASFGITPASRAYVHGDPSEWVIRRAGEIGAAVIVLDGGSNSYAKSKVVGASPCHVLVLPRAT